MNIIIASDNESPPRVEELIRKHEGTKYFTTTDLIKGYWQVSLSAASRKYTAFLHQGKLFQFKMIPFGLKTAWAGFMCALDLALDNELREYITNYVDDILIALRMFETVTSAINVFGTFILLVSL